MKNPEDCSYIRSFGEIQVGDVSIVGGKGANLGEMTRAGLAVPPGFCLTAEAYRVFTHTQARAGIRHILDDMHLEDPEDVERKSEKIRHLLLDQAIPSDIAQQTVDSYHRLGVEMGAREGEPIPVAVRSSATAEDLPNASFAGQQDTYLNIRGDEALLEHVKRCWASLWTARAVTYRIKQGFEHEKVALAVVVQAMVESEVSGIMFTANPVTGNRNQIVINASWGLGEAIVSGMVTPDTFTVDKSDDKIVERDIADKELLIEYMNEGGTVERAATPEQRKIPSLDDRRVVELARLGKRIEQHYGAPMDMEWGLAKDHLYVLQARPITTLTQEPVFPSKGTYDRRMFLEIFPDPLSPVMLSAVETLFHKMLDYSFMRLGFTPPQRTEAIRSFYNQPYFHDEYVQAAVKPLHSPFRERFAALIVQPFGSHTTELGSDHSLAFLKMTWNMLLFMLRFPKRLPQVVSRYHKEVAQIAALPVHKMSDSEIFGQMIELVYGTLSRLLNYDFLMIAVVRFSNQMLGSWLERYFGKDSDEVRSKLVSGVTGNVTMKTNLRLWDLAQMGKSSPTVRSILRAGGADMQLKLRETKDGRAFLAEMERFIAEFGHREVKMDITVPTWVEDPAPVYAFVRGYLDVPESQSPYTQQDRLVKQRQETAKMVQKRINRGVVGRLVIWPVFHLVLKQTQTHTRERDTMHFEFTRVFPPFRCFLLELGERWTERGVVSRPEDIFFLTLDEINEMAASPKPVHDLVARRTAELERSQVRTAPARIVNGKAEVIQDTEHEAPPDGQLKGIAGSPGVVRGVARVIRGPEEFDRLQPGEILVAPLTNPVWTPLFAIASGLLTEVGGILSHGAIVAREYGIPAVMAVPQITRTIKDGQQLTIDGNKGIVILE